MKRFLLAALLSVVGITSNATVLTFDDIATSSPDYIGVMPTYKGFTFNDTSNWVDTVGSLWNYGARSGQFTMMNNYGGASVIQSEDGADFTFDGLWAKTWDNAGARAGAIRGFNNGTEVWVSNVNLTNDFGYVAAVTGMIDELRIDLGDYFLVDDVALNNPAVDVPEPASLALLGLGLAGVAVARRRRVKQA